MGIRAPYAAFGGVVGAMLGSVLAAAIIILSALVALLSPFGLSPAVKALFWALIVIAFLAPAAGGIYAGARWARRIERRPGFHERREREKAYVFLGFALVVAVALALFALWRLG